MTPVLGRRKQLGRANTRAVVVVHPDISDAELRAMHEGGVCGVRFSLFQPKHVSTYVPARAVVDFDMVERLAHRIHDMGWHTQLHWNADQIYQHRTLLNRLPTPLVFDHFARLPVDEGVRHPAYSVLRELLDRGNTWIKLSGAYLDSQLGADDHYRDIDPIARAWLALAPEKLVWGSDWPHPSAGKDIPDDGLLLDMLSRWTDVIALQDRVLVTNPATLYGFVSEAPS